MRNIVTLTWKVLAIATANFAAMLIAGSLLAALIPVGGGGQAVLPAMAAVSLLHALVIAWLLGRSALPRLQAWIWASLVVIGVETVMQQVELIVFGRFITAVSPSAIAIGAGMNSLAALAACAAAAVLLVPRDRSGGPAPGWNPAPTAWAWRLAATGALYVVVFYAAGAVFVWSVPEARTFYGHGANIDSALVVPFEFGRGLLWALLALTIARGLTKSRAETALLTGGAFSILHASQLLFAEGVFPEAVRRAHLIEVSTENLVFGIAAALLVAPLARGKAGANAALTATTSG